MATKWDILQARLQLAKEEVANREAEIEWLETTPLWAPGSFAAQPMRCGTCGTELPTEAAFAQHYVVPDPRYLNLGHCPTKDGPGL
jgi:hypothetical protein